MRVSAAIACLALACGGLEAQPPSSARPAEPSAAQPAVFVDAADFEAARRAGASVLDARSAGAYASGHVPGAVHTPWERFVDGERSGLLSADRGRLQAELRRAGVDAGRAVLVYGEWDRAWGEEGRLFWMLEYLGHRDVRILRGGAQAYTAAGLSLTRQASSPRPGDFTIAPREAIRARTEDVQRSLERGDATLLDIRTAAEYAGLTPHGSARGGHIPTAIHFHWHDVFADGGALRPAPELRKRLEALGVRPDRPVIAYCTGGIRSGFMYAVMRWAGYPRASNYDGSFWQWSAQRELPVER